MARSFALKVSKAKAPFLLIHSLSSFQPANFRSNVRLYPRSDRGRSSLSVGHIICGLQMESFRSGNQVRKSGQLW